MYFDPCHGCLPLFFSSSDEGLESGQEMVLTKTGDLFFGYYFSDDGEG